MQLLKWVWTLSLLLTLTDASEVLVNTQAGQALIFEINPEESLNELQKHIEEITEGETFIITIPPKKYQGRWEVSKQGSYLGRARDFAAIVTQKEKDDIHFIVTSLADKSLISIAFIKGDLEAAGDRIDHIHPLRFLSTIFTDERMKVAIRNIRGRGWIWNHFVGGLKNCLSTEARIGNMKDIYLLQFAQTIQLELDKIYPPICAQNWDAFIEILIHEIPRKGNHDRYDN